MTTSSWKSRMCAVCGHVFYVLASNERTRRFGCVADARMQPWVQKAKEPRK